MAFMPRRFRLCKAIAFVFGGLQLILPAPARDFWFGLAVLAQGERMLPAGILAEERGSVHPEDVRAR